MFVPVHERKRGAQLKPATAAQFFFAYGNAAQIPNEHLGNGDITRVFLVKTPQASGPQSYAPRPTRAPLQSLQTASVNIRISLGVDLEGT